MTRPRVVYTAGVWDLLHRGHLNLLWASKQYGDILVVGVVSDAGTAAYKGQYPVESEGRRFRALERLPFIDVVVAQQGTNPTENLRRFRPNTFTHGDDWIKLREGHETLAELGIRFVLLPYTSGISTTLLRQAQNIHLLETMEVVA